MPDTTRTLDYFLNASTGAFKDNTTGDITPQGLRDFSLSAYRPQAVNGYRLSTENGVSVSTADRTAQSTLYIVPHEHNALGVNDGTNISNYKTISTTSGFSLALSGMTSGKNYDVVAYEWSGTPELDLLPAWTNDTTRATALVMGYYRYISGTATGLINARSLTNARYVGTIRATGATTTEDSASKRFVWNAFNQVPRPVRVIDTTDNYPYQTAAFRQVRATATNQFEYVCGLSERPIVARARGAASHSVSSAEFCSGIGIDSTTVNSAQLFGGSSSVVNQFGSCHADYEGYPGIGYHYVAWLEYSRITTGTLTWYGDGGIATLQTGLMGHVWG